MKLLTAVLIATGLCAWLAGDAVQPEPSGDDRPADAGEVPAVRPAAADDSSAENRPPSPPGPRRGGKTGDRPGRGQFNGPRGQGPFGPKFRHPGEGPDAKPLSPEEIDRLMEFARQNFPELHERLSHLQESNPPAFQHMINRARGPMGEILRMARDNPELAKKLIQIYRVETGLAELRRRYHHASSDQQREQTKADIRAQLEKRFDLRLKRSRFEIRMLEKRLEEAKKSLAERERDKEKFIEAELEQQLTPGKHRPPDFPRRRMHKRDQLPPPPPGL